jgi:DNA polymerase III epsilon subunit family exonuclease
MWRSNETKEALYEVMKPGNQIIFFDTETTGFSAEKNDIIQFSAIKKIVNEAYKLEELERIDKYINPGYSIPPKITEITGISDETVEFAEDAEAIFKKYIYPFMGEKPNLVAHNAPFDIRFMNALYEANGEIFNTGIVIDTLQIARDLVSDEDSKKKNLESIAKLYGIDNDLTFHNSLDDVIAISRLLPIFNQEYKDKDEEKKVSYSGTKQIPIIKSMHYWPGYRGYARIYIHTNLGAFFFDIRKKVWDKKSDNLIDINTVDMEELRRSAYKLANATNDLEFARYRD